MRSFRSTSRKSAYGALESLFRYPEKVFIIHYSCGPFFESVNSPKIVSISLTNLDSKQSYSFSIHLAAEILDLPLNLLSPSQYRQAETKVLQDFVNFLREHEDCYFVHWSMNNATFGFGAIFHRYQVLCGENESIPKIKKIDIHNILEEIYSEGYECHNRIVKKGREVYQVNGRLLCLAHRNNIKLFEAVSGIEEVEYYRKGAYNKMHESTLRKTFIVRRILKLTLTKELKVRSPIKQYGWTIQGVFEYAKSNWVGAIILAIFGALIQLLLISILT